MVLDDSDYRACPGCSMPLWTLWGITFFAAPNSGSALDTTICVDFAALCIEAGLVADLEKAPSLCAPQTCLCTALTILPWLLTSPWCILCNLCKFGGAPRKVGSPGRESESACTAACMSASGLRLLPVRNHAHGRLGRQSKTPDAVDHPEVGFARHPRHPPLRGG